MRVPWRILVPIPDVSSIFMFSRNARTIADTNDLKWVIRRGYA